MKKLGRIYPPIAIPFSDDESIDWKGYESNLEMWANQPLDGIVAPGSNSEAPFLTYNEKTKLWKTGARIMQERGKHLIAGSGAETTRETIRLTKNAADAGAVAALVIPPHFFIASMGYDSLVRHYYAVADNSPIPLLIYNVPAFTGVDIDPRTLVKLSEHPQIIGMKDSSANVVKASFVLAKCRDFLVYSGSGSALLPFLAIGGYGGIMALANIAAVELRQLCDAFLSNNWNIAREIQLSVIELNTAITAKYGIPGLKHAMYRMGYTGGTVRSPLIPIGDAGKSEVDALISKIQNQKNFGE